MKLIITGGCGFLGSNLAAHALERKDELIIFDNLSREGARQNLEWLKRLGKFTYYHGDIRNNNDVFNLISNNCPSAVFHLAGQVAMTTSITNPRLDFEINTIGTHNLLEAIRQCAPKTKVVYSSTNKVYGDLEQFTYRESETRFECLEKPNGFDEETPLDFQSPYGCSKGAADQFILDYARIFGLQTIVFRHSSMYGGRQYPSADQGWVGWFCRKALEGSKGNSDGFTISGNGKQVRDVLHAEDMIRLYFNAIERFDIATGQVFNIGGGVENSLSLLELFKLLESILNVRLNYRTIEPRKSDQRVFIADITKARRVFDWKPSVEPRAGIVRMVEWIATTFDGKL